MKKNIKKTVCIIPARAGSKRLKKKNFLKIKNKMLIEYTIQAAIDSKIFSYIVVSTDFKKIFSLKKKYRSIEILKRPQKLLTDKSTVDQVCLNILKKNKFYHKCDYICVLYPTAIMRTKQDISNAFKKFIESKSFSLMGVRKASIPHKILRLRNGYLKKNFKGQNPSIKSNKYSNQFFKDNGSMYFAKMSTYLRQKTFYTSRLIGYKMSGFKSIDIDNKESLDKIKLLLRKKIVRL